MYNYINKLFVGKPKQDFFKFLSLNSCKLLAYDKIIIPAVGTFSIPLYLVNLGYNTEKIYASDIAQISDLIYKYISDPSENIVNEITKFHLDNIREKYKKRNVVFDNYKLLFKVKIKEKLKQLEKLKGINYENNDLRKVMSAKRAERELIIINPPNIDKGYEKFYPKAKVSIYEQFAKSEVMSLFVDTPAIIHTSLPLKKGDSYSIVGMYQLSNKSFTKIYSNIVGVQKYLNYKFKQCEANYEMATVEDLKNVDVVKVQKIDESTAYGLRDLFIHKLATTKAERTVVILINGKIFAVVGINLKFLISMQSEYIFEIFGMTVQLKSIKTAKLMLMFLLTNEFANYVKNSTANSMELNIKGVKTVCLSKYPEVKTDRGVLELKKREFLKDKGIYKLTYQSDIKYKLFIEAYNDWRKKYGTDI